MGIKQLRGDIWVKYRRSMKRVLTGPGRAFVRLHIAMDAGVFLKKQLAASSVSHTFEVARNLGLTWRPWQDKAKWL